MNLLLWATAAVASLVIATALALRWGDRRDSQVVCATAYLKAYRITKDKKASVRAAAAVLRKREPFAAMTDDDVEFLADLFSDFHHPQAVLGRVIRRAENRRSAGLLSDRDFLQAFAKAARAEGA